MKKIILLVVFANLLSGCSLTQEWTGFYYPDKNDIGNTSKWKIQSGFKTVKNCRGWIAQTAGSNPTFDYECGLNCKENKYGVYICEKTVN
jgi:hypothetical protein